MARWRMCNSKLLRAQAEGADAYFIIICDNRPDYTGRSFLKDVEMNELKVRTRETGAIAVMPHGQTPTVTTPTGGTVDVVIGVSQPGFNPLDLLYASVAACMALSARIAAGKMGVGDKLVNVRVEVKGKKAEDAVSRVVQFETVFHIEGDLDEKTKHDLIEMAETLCTVSNTLRGDPVFDTRLA